MKKVPAPAWASEVKALRESLGLTQDEFAVRVGVAGSTVGYWEAGKVAPHKRTRERVRTVAAAGSSDAMKSVSRRYSAETISVLHHALDIILDNADSSIVSKVSADLTKFAGQWGIPSERGSLQRGLDKAGIISDVIAPSPARAAEQVGKEAQERVHPQQKKKQSNPSKIA